MPVTTSQLHERLRARVRAGTTSAPAVFPAPARPSLTLADLHGAHPGSADPGLDLQVSKLDRARLVLVDARQRLAWGPGSELLAVAAERRLTLTPLATLGAHPASLLGRQLEAEAQHLSERVEQEWRPEHAELLVLDDRGRLPMPRNLLAALHLGRNDRVLVMTEYAASRVTVLPVDVVATALNFPTNPEMTA